MKSKYSIIILGLLIFAAGSIYSQGLADRNAKNKNSLIEEFTGVACQYCPDGHTIADNIVNKYPGKVFVVAYHPSNGSFNTPYAGDEDLRRDWPSSFWGSFSGSTGMPGAFINRRLYGGARSTGRGSWDSYSSAITKEASPCNVGLVSGYDKSKKVLTVDVEVYFTSAVSDKYHIYAILIEDSVITHQVKQGLGWLTGYIHKRTFREGITDVWGDKITESTTSGASVKRKYTFNNTKNYNMDRCSVLVFVRNATNEEIVTCNGGLANAQKLFLSTEETLSGAASPGEPLQKVFTIRNFSGSQMSISVSAGKSQRTPSDWVADVVLPTTAEKKSDNPQAGGTIKINPGETADVTLKLTPGETIGVGDAILRAQETSPGKELRTMQMTAVSSNVEYIEVTDDETITKNSSILNVVKTSGRNNFVQFDPGGFTEVQSYLNNLKIVLWSSGQTGGISDYEAGAIKDMVDKGVYFLISGAAPLNTLYEIDSENPLFSTLGITWDSEGEPFTNKTLTIQGESGDKAFSGIYISSTLLEDIPITPIKVIDESIANPIMKINSTKQIIAAKAETQLSKIVVLHFNPLIPNTSADEVKLIDAVLDWLEAPHSVGPQATLSVTEMAFGEVKTGQNKDMEVEITNSGDKFLDVKLIEIIGNNPEYFTIQSGGVKTLDPGDKHKVVVKFTPETDLTENKDYDALLEIKTNVNGETNHEVPLSGTGTGEPNDVDDTYANLLKVSVTPNPAGSQSSVNFDLQGVNPAFVNAYLADASGKTARTIYNETMRPGNYSFQLSSAGLASGSYYLVVKSVYGNYNIQVVINK